MAIIVHSTESRESIVANIGARDYSYYFVLEKYRKVMQCFAQVIEIRDPEREVDVIYNECRARGEPCLFFSFTPPFKAATNLQCPTICVFAWEYATIPTDTWAEDPRHDWRTVFSKHGCAITHSEFAVRAVRRAMGDDFPVWSIPAPVWDDYKGLYKNGRASAQSRGFDLSFKGVLIDFQGCPASCPPEESGAVFAERKSSLAPNDKIKVHLKGIIYTAVFNPNDGRKNWLDLIWGFCWAFRDVEDVTLVMKLVYYDFEAVRAMVVNEIKKLAPFKCRVVALHGYLDHDEYARLIRESTYVVNTAHGEGQCLPLMEFMSAGKPAIAPAHTAMEDYVNEDNAFVVKSSVEWIHWPHDPRAALRTMRYRIDWETLYRAYLESYAVAKGDPVRYARMSGDAVRSLKQYCSKAVVKNRLKQILCERGVVKDGVWAPFVSRVWQKAMWRRRFLLKMAHQGFKKRSPKRAAGKRDKSAPAAGQRGCGAESPHPQAPDPTLIDASLSGWFKHESAELIEGFKISARDVVLDVGCGDSPFLHFCAMQGARVVFVDIDEQKVAAMKKHLAGSPARSVAGYVSDACALPVRDASVSRIIAMEVMEHVDDPAVFLEELFRVGKPGAQYLITVPDPVAERLQKELAPPSYFEKPNHVRVIEREAFEKLVTGAGLVVEKRRFYGFYWSIWWMFFWACKQDLRPPWHPLLESWTQTWQRLLATEDGARVKRVLDDFLPKSQAIIARKPDAPI
jgi:SAM-dependent methyltransferase/glycosyltransferase involved in cell wall biosynthesis